MHKLDLQGVESSYLQNHFGTLFYFLEEGSKERDEIDWMSKILENTSGGRQAAVSVAYFSPTNKMIILTETAMESKRMQRRSLATLSFCRL
jgi:hypothetical protein